jgi:predicted ribosome quality control (RQC) complex YloA/Tae2 family protein
MEATFFRFLARELTPRLTGRRIEKIYAPAPGIWNLKLGADLFLLFGSARQCTFLFTAGENPGSPPTPTAQVMWLRKRLKNRRILATHTDWPNRLLALELTPGEGRYLVIDPATGPSLASELHEGFGADPGWPTLGQILSDPEIWRRYPQLSPSLRRHLTEIPPPEAELFLDRLARGERDMFTLLPTGSGGLNAVPWRAGGEGLSSATEAAAHVGRTCLSLILSSGDAERRERSAARKRLQRALDRVAGDMRRMERLQGLQEDGLLLKSLLSEIDARAKRSSVTIQLEGGGEREITLEPSISVLENMERMFRRAAKGKRGLKILAERLAMLEQELARLEHGLPAGAGGGRPRVQGGQPAQRPTKDPDMARYRTSDGFLLLRGRNKEANHRLLTRKASPFDLWFHVQDGPGAHVILKRDHGEQEVPERSLEEAAAIAGLSSYCRGEGQALVMCARVRDVRTIKGQEAGRVRVDRVLRSVLVRLDPELEKRLAV